MQSFTYVIKDELGFHARPAGLFAKMVSQYPEDEVTISFNGKVASAKRLMALMGLGAGHGDKLEVKVEGPNEAETAAAVKDFLEKNL